MLDETDGWAVGTAGRILITRDSGSTWKDVSPSTGSYSVAGFFALDAETAWATQAAGCETCTDLQVPVHAAVWYTTDAGQNWQRSQPFYLGTPGFEGGNQGVAYYLPVDMQFVDDQTGWLLVSVNFVLNQEHYRLFQTTDGGENWNRITDKDSGPVLCKTFGIAFLDTQTGLLGDNCVGRSFIDEKWNVHRTYDGGVTWELAQLPAPGNLPAGFDGFYYDCASGRPTFVSPDAFGLEMDCALYNKDSGYSSYQFYYLSRDGRQTWTSWLATGPVDFVNPLVGWQIFSSGSGQPNELQQTLEGGQSWTTLKTVLWEGQLDFVSEQVGWALARSGDQFALLLTIDGGRSWHELSPHLVIP